MRWSNKVNISYLKALSFRVYISKSNGAFSLYCVTRQYLLPARTWELEVHSDVTRAFYWKLWNKGNLRVERVVVICHWKLIEIVYRGFVCWKLNFFSSSETLSFFVLVSGNPKAVEIILKSESDSPTSLLTCVWRENILY